MRPSRMLFVGMSLCFCAAICNHTLWAQTKAEPEAPQKAVREGEQVVVSAQTPVPRLVKFVGTLKDAKGEARTGVVGITFALYDQQEGGAPLWLETHNVTLDEQGRYSVLLGATKSAGIPLDLFITGEPRWLGIQVQLPGETESDSGGRVLLVSVPYALKAADADTLGGKPASAFVLGEKLGEELRRELQTQAEQTAESVREGKQAAVTVGGVQATTFSDSNSSEVLLVQQNGTGVGLRALAVTGSAITGESASTVDAVISASATAGTGAAAGVRGNSNSTSGRGVFGSAGASTGGTIGVLGTADSDSGVGIFGEATSATGATFGLRGRSFSTSGVGLSGDALATTGATIGVWGRNFSTSGTGLLGEAVATTGATFGLKGLNASTSGVGLNGEATAVSGNTLGIFGRVFSADGTAAAFDNAAGGKILSARVNGVEKVGIYGTGNVGIGTTSPTEKLDIVGNLKVSGTITGLTSVQPNVLALPATASASSGVITLAGGRFLHAFGSQNTFLGFNAGNFSLEGDSNTATGENALRTNTTGGSNTAIGRSALEFNTTGDSNTAIGRSALLSNTTGSQNVAIGERAGVGSTINGNTTGSGNTFIGVQAAPGVNTPLTNATAIGGGALVNCSNCLVLGSGVNVGIGTSTPAEKLDVVGNVKATSFLGSLAASNLTGTVADARLSTNVALVNAMNTFVGSQNITGNLAVSGTISGSGSGLTSLNASNLSSGTMDDGRLSSNVARRNAANTFTGSQTFDTSGPTTVVRVQPIGGANTSAGADSIPIELVALSLSSITTLPVEQRFQWRSEPVGNHTETPSGRLSLLYGSGNNTPEPTALSISPAGIITFAPSQTFPNVSSLGSANTFTAQNVFTASPTGSGVGAGPVYINPASSPNPDETLFGAAVNGLEKLRLSNDGRLSLSGTLELPNTSNAFTGVIRFGGARFIHNIGNFSTFVGKDAGSLSSGGNSTAVGYEALFSNTGVSNTALGANALRANIGGGGNTAIGADALLKNETGLTNTAVGVEAGVTATLANANVSGSDNTFLGFRAGPASSTQRSNATAIGANALVDCSNCMVLGDGTVKVGIGISAPAEKLDVVGNVKLSGTLNLPSTAATAGVPTAGVIKLGSDSFLHAFGTTGNTFLGLNAGNFTLGNLAGFNTAIGASALQSLTQGFSNTAIGFRAGVTAASANANLTGTNNTFIGTDSGPGTSTQLDNATAIGATALVNCSNCMVLGSGVNVGIGTSTPGAKLQVVGDVKLGSSGALFAPGGTENLRMLRGIVNANGTISVGSGFTINRTSAGIYIINFDSSFGGLPATTVTPHTSGAAAGAIITSVSISAVTVVTFDAAFTATDFQFSFIALGPR